MLMLSERYSVGDSFEFTGVIEDDNGVPIPFDGNLILSGGLLTPDKVRTDLIFIPDPDQINNAGVFQMYSPTPLAGIGLAVFDIVQSYPNASPVRESTTEEYGFYIKARV